MYEFCINWGYLRRQTENILLVPVHEWIHYCIWDWNLEWYPYLIMSTIWLMYPPKEARYIPFVWWRLCVISVSVFRWLVRWMFGWSSLCGCTFFRFFKWDFLKWCFTLLIGWKFNWYFVWGVAQGVGKYCDKWILEMGGGWFVWTDYWSEVSEPIFWTCFNRRISA